AGDHRLGAVAHSPEAGIGPSRPRLRGPIRPRNDRRALLILAVLAVGAAGLAYLGYRAARFAIDWLGAQGPYQGPFSGIRLDPEPPPWYRGGAPRFLETVRRRAGEAEALPVLALEPGRVRSAFLEDPWVEGVVSVSYPPRGIRVELVYRQPV